MRTSVTLQGCGCCSIQTVFRSQAVYAILSCILPTTEVYLLLLHSPLKQISATLQVMGFSVYSSQAVFCENLMCQQVLLLFKFGERCIDQRQAARLCLPHLYPGPAQSIEACSYHIAAYGLVLNLNIVTDCISFGVVVLGISFVHDKILFIVCRVCRVVGSPTYSSQAVFC